MIAEREAWEAELKKKKGDDSSSDSSASSDSSTSSTTGGGEPENIDDEDRSLISDSLYNVLKTTPADKYNLLEFLAEDDTVLVLQYMRGKYKKLLNLYVMRSFLTYFFFSALHRLKH